MSLVHTVMESLNTVNIENFVDSNFPGGSFFHVFQGLLLSLFLVLSSLNDCESRKQFK